MAIAMPPRRLREAPGGAIAADHARHDTDAGLCFRAQNGLASRQEQGGADTDKKPSCNELEHGSSRLPLLVVADSSLVDVVAPGILNENGETHRSSVADLFG
jgi:hypothetical protein